MCKLILEHICSSPALSNFPLILPHLAQPAGHAHLISLPSSPVHTAACLHMQSAQPILTSPTRTPVTDLFCSVLSLMVMISASAFALLCDRLVTVPAACSLLKVCLRCHYSGSDLFFFFFFQKSWTSNEPKYLTSLTRYQVHLRKQKLKYSRQRLYLPASGNTLADPSLSSYTHMQKCSSLVFCGAVWGLLLPQWLWRGN